MPSQKPISKTIFWLFLVFTFGLMQLWIDLAIHVYTSSEKIDWVRLLKDGVLLFFVMGVTTGITIDYHLDEVKSTTGSLLRSACFVFVPSVIMILVVMAYIAAKSSMDSRQEEIFFWLNVYSLSLSTLYAAAAKFFLFD